jgi:NADPH-dependent 2,4-dienoyl-CoA reductase/sulfur reductase-like enzyme
MGTPVGPYLALAGEVRRQFGIPVLHAARINDVATARHAVAEGYLDLVGMTRAHMAESHIAAKISRGEEHRIRPCVGASYCIDRIYEGGEALCIHNPATGREATMPHVVRRSEGPRRKIVVVGAGPAGLEAARVSAERGHSVVLFEAASQAGGQVRLAAAIGRRKEILGIIDWRMAECEHLGVGMRFNVLADANDIRAEDPDVVIIATGGLPNTSFLANGEELVNSSWDLLSGAVAPAEEVLLFDDNGAHHGLTAAEYIALAGSKLEFATPERIVGPDVGGMNYPAYLKVFAERNVTITLNQRLRSVRRDGNKLVAVLFNEYAKTTQERRVDQVVVEHGIVPLEEVYFALKEAAINRGELDQEAFIACRPQELVRNPQGKFRLYRIGDAVAGRNIHAAVYDALRLCIAV